MNPLAFIPLAGKLVTGFLEGRRQVQLAKIEAEVARVKRDQDAERDWDLEALRQSRYSWKDEFLLVVITTPYLYGMFAVVYKPEAIEHLRAYFTLLNEFPVWWQTSFVGVVAASFGLRWLFSKRQERVVDKVVKSRHGPAVVESKDTPATFD